MSKIIPEFPGGTVMYPPGTMIPRLAMFTAIRDVFDRFGFSPIETPVLQKELVLTGGDEHMRVFKINEESRTNSARALRFDLTVPLSVYVAMNTGTLSLPFKRSEIGPVFRPETAQRGRYNQFYQCDIDIAGVESGVADAEIIAVMVATLKALSVQNFMIRINNRKILNALPDFVGFDPAINADVLRILDKLDKIGSDGVRKELQSNRKTKLSNEQCGTIETFLSIKDRDPKKVLSVLEVLIGNSEIGKQGIAELHEILSYLPSFGVTEESFVIDLSVARGLGYYTGIVFETTLTDIPEIGSVFSGGRYDDLIDRFGSRVPAVGASVGIDRLFTALETLGLISKQKTVTKILVLNIFEEAKNKSIELITALRKSGISADLYMGKETGMGAQLGYANSLDITFVVIIGEDEFNKQIAIIKDMKNKEQIKKPLDHLVGHFVNFCKIS